MGEGSGFSASNLQAAACVRGVKLETAITARKGNSSIETWRGLETKLSKCSCMLKEVRGEGRALFSTAVVSPRCSFELYFRTAHTHA